MSIPRLYATSKLSWAVHTAHVLLLLEEERSIPILGLRPEPQNHVTGTKKRFVGSDRVDLRCLPAVEPPAVAHASTASFSFDRLPTDVLRLILVRIPFRPLMLVMRHVCQRWNRTAPLVVTKLSERWLFRIPESALLSFVNLIVWREVRDSLALQKFLPERIRVLHLYDLEAMRTNMLPHLTALHYTASASDDSLDRNDLHFPALRALSLSFYEVVGCLHLTLILNSARVMVNFPRPSLPLTYPT